MMTLDQTDFTDVFTGSGEQGEDAFGNGDENEQDDEHEMFLSYKRKKLFYLVIKSKKVISCAEMQKA